MKQWYESKEIWLSLAVISNSLLSVFNLPAVAWTPELVGAVGVLFLALRTWFTEAKIRF